MGEGDILSASHTALHRVVARTIQAQLPLELLFFALKRLTH
jgi:hypothetical protein